MTKLSKKFRSISDGMAAGADEVKKSMSASAGALSGVRGQLIELGAIQEIGVLHARIKQIVNSMPTDLSQQTLLAGLIVGSLTANLYQALADVIEEERPETKWTHGLRDLRERNSEFQTKLNKASAKGDWDEFDRLAASGSGDDGTADASTGVEDSQSAERASGD